MDGHRLQPEKGKEDVWEMRENVCSQVRRYGFNLFFVLPCVTLGKKNIISLVWGILDAKTMVNIADLMGMVLGFPETIPSPRRAGHYGKEGSLICSAWLPVHERS